MSDSTLSKDPTADPAEQHEAYFPSPYSLDAYTAPRTDFDGLATERHAWIGGRWKVLGKALQDEGVRVVNDDMTGRCTIDRTVITGDSPLAANELGKLTATALLEQARRRG